MDLLLLPPAGPIQTAPPAALWLPGLLLLPAAKATVSFRKARPFPRFASNARTTFSARASSSSMSPPSEAPAPAPASPPDTPPCTRWVVVTQKPPIAGSSKSEVIDYYVRTLARVLGSEKEAQMSIYDASWQSNFGFCCDIEEEPSRELARVPGILLVRPDKDPEFKKKDYSYSNLLLGHQSTSDAPASRVSPSGGDFEYWIVRMEKPGVQVITKAQMVDYYAQTLTKVLGNEKDAQVSIYNISWEKDFGFCCQIDEECAQDLADVPGVLSVRPDMNFESENKNYKGDGSLHNTKDISDSSETSQTLEVRTKRLFVTGLSFYTSEKTLRAAFEGFGELVEVKIIMDKISKRSKGYAFIEYTAEEAASRALKEMNGKIINGWMIVVDVAKTNPPKYSRRSPRPLSSSSSVLS